MPSRGQVAGVPGGIGVLDALQVNATRGSAIWGITAGTISVDFPAATATVGDIVEVAVTITGVAAGDLVIMAPATAVAADVLWAVVQVSANTVTLRATQGTASQDAAATTFNYLWFDLTE
jgi:hypothetical protein